MHLLYTFSYLQPAAAVAKTPTKARHAMHRGNIALRWQHGLLAALCLLALQAQAQAQAQSWQTQGYARYEEFNRPIFIATLQTPDAIASISEVLDGQRPFRIELAIDAETLSGSRFRRLWLEGISINHTPEQLRQQTGELAAFSEFLAPRLYRGDRFTVEYRPDGGTRIRHNEQSMADLHNSKLALMLLRGWLGDIPLSSQFKQELITPVSTDTALATRFASLQPRARITAPAAEANPPAVTAVTAAAKPAITTTTIQPPVIQPTVAQKTAPTPAAPARPPQSAVTTANAVTPIPDTTTTAVPDDTETGSALDTDFDQELLALHQSYYTQLVREVSKYKTIPFQAFQRRWEGTVKMQVTIDRQGHIIARNIIEDSPHQLLNQQALDAVASAEPFSAIPTRLNTAEFTFSVQLDYRLAH